MKITSISFQNFCSFRDQIKMSFLVNEKAPRTHHFGQHEGDKGDSRFSKVSSIFGANGAGKTTLIVMFNFLQSFVSESFSYSDDGFSILFSF